MLLSFLLSVSLAQASPLQVVTSSPILKDLIENVGGNEIQVNSLDEAFRDPHNFDPSVKTIKSIQSSQVSFIVGEKFELWAKSLLAKPNYKGEVFRFSDHLNLEQDSHFWMSPSLTLKAVDLIEKELSRLKPRSAALFKQKAQAYKGNIQSLSDRLKLNFLKLPPNERVWVSESGALLLFCEDFGIELITISRRSHRSEITAKELSQAHKRITEKKASLYIFETHQPRNSALQRAKDLGLIPKGPIYIETFGDRGQSPQTYLELLEKNSDALLSQTSTL